MDNPCRNCKDRKIIGNTTCHSNCDKYATWKAEYLDIKKSLKNHRKIWCETKKR